MGQPSYIGKKQKGTLTVLVLYRGFTCDTSLSFPTTLPLGPFLPVFSLDPVARFAGVVPEHLPGQRSSGYDGHTGGRLCPDQGSKLEPHATQPSLVGRAAIEDLGVFLLGNPSLG